MAVIFWGKSHIYLRVRLICKKTIFELIIGKRLLSMHSTPKRVRKEMIEKA